MNLALLAIILAVVVYLPGQHLAARLLGLTGHAFSRDAGSLDSFTPEVWAQTLLSSLKKDLVFGAPNVVNHDYEGLISQQGDTVKINSISRPTIGDYVKGVTSITPEQLTAESQNLTVDQAKYFAFEVDDIDKAQNAGNVMPEAMTEAGYGLADTADQFIASLYAGADSANALGTVTSNTADLCFTQLRKLRTTLTKANVPTQGRYAIVPPEFLGLLLERPGLIQVADAGSDDALRNGLIGRLLGFDLYESNNCPLITTNTYRVCAGVSKAISFADQISKTEAYRPQDSFSDAVKGLHVYGAKLILPEAVATVDATVV